MSEEIRIPCHQVLGHGDYCSKGHLCDSCEEILQLREEIKELKSLVKQVYEDYNGPYESNYFGWEKWRKMAKKTLNL
jgi:hypothetical protein